MNERRAYARALAVIVPTALFLAACVVYSIDRLVRWNELELEFRILMPVFLVLCSGVLVVLLFVLCAPLVAHLPNPFVRRRSTPDRYIPVLDGEPDDSARRTHGDRISESTETWDFMNYLEEDERAALSHLDERTRRLLLNALPFGMNGEDEHEGPMDYGIETDDETVCITRNGYFAALTVVLSGCVGHPTYLRLPDTCLSDFHIVSTEGGFDVRFQHQAGEGTPAQFDCACRGISCLHEPVDLRPVLMDDGGTLLDRTLSVVRMISFKSALLGSDVLSSEESELLEAHAFLTSLESYRLRRLDLPDAGTLDEILAFLSGRHDSLHAAFQAYRNGLSSDGHRPSGEVRKALDREMARFMNALEAQLLLKEIDDRIDRVMSRFPPPKPTRIPGFEGLVSAADGFLQQKGFTGAYPEYRRTRKGRTDSIEFGFVPNSDALSPFHAIGIRAGIRNRPDDYTRICLFNGSRILTTDLGDSCDPATDETVQSRVSVILGNLLRVLEGGTPDADFLQTPLYRGQCVPGTSRELAIVGWSAVGIETALSLALIFNRIIDRWIGAVSEGDVQAASWIGLVFLTCSAGFAFAIWFHTHFRLRHPKILRLA